MRERLLARAPADLALRASAYLIDGMIAGGAKLLLRATGAPGLVGFAVVAGYYTAMPYAYDGQTFGKMAAGIAVADEKGCALTLGQCFGRFCGWLLSAALLGAGYLVAFFNPERRALHDHVAATRVIAVSRLEGTRRWVVLALGLGGLASSFVLLFFGGLVALVAGR